jgi:hypothetical protein
MQVLLESGALTTRPVRARDIHTHYVCEVLTELLIYFMVVFSPWAFGTTQAWSIWIMNVCGYSLGLLLLVKLTIRKRGYRCAQWGEEEIVAAEVRNSERPDVLCHRRRTRLSPATFTRALVFLTLCILAYCFIAAVNRRATFNSVTMALEYYDCLRWLPHSLESRSTWKGFCTCLALACSFWAIRDWLTGKASGEQQMRWLGLTRDSLPIKVRRLLLVLSISGGLLGLEGIVQRVWQSPRLLFLVVPEIHQSAQEQFASYAYRANGAQYFNLLWPVCLGFWWKMHRSENKMLRSLLMTCLVTMAACPIISSARGAVLVDLAMLSIVTLVLLSDSSKARRRPGADWSSGVLVVVFLAASLALGLGLGWKSIRSRIGEFSQDLRERNELYERGHLIARDYPVFGTGPGTFERVFQLYRSTPRAYWPTQLHNDWLETRITFGWIGSGLIAAALLAVLLRWFGRGGIQSGTRFIILVWLSLAGCLVQARWDFPLQVYSILFLFLVWCALLSTLCRRQ